MLGLTTGKSKGVSTTPLLVFNFPILASKSFSLTSKLILKPKTKTIQAYLNNIFDIIAQTIFVVLADSVRLSNVLSKT
jgi:hypothetical protein